VELRASRPAAADLAPAAQRPRRGQREPHAGDRLLAAGGIEPDGQAAVRDEALQVRVARLQAQPERLAVVDDADARRRAAAGREIGLQAGPVVELAVDDELAVAPVRGELGRAAAGGEQRGESEAGEGELTARRRDVRQESSSRRGERAERAGAYPPVPLLTRAPVPRPIASVDQRRRNPK